MDSNTLTWIFGTVTALSVGYFLFSIITNASDASGYSDGEFGLTIAAAFFAMFGAVGLLGTLSGWSVIVTLVAALIVGLVAGRAVFAFLRFIMRQQSVENTEQINDLIGKSARVTIDSPEGKTGEAIIEANYVLKYAVKEINSEALQRGDTVEIVDTASGILFVKKKRRG
jgi:membrane protein implicated in regulation of membrane protease activity